LSNQPNAAFDSAARDTVARATGAALPTRRDDRSTPSPGPVAAAAIVGNTGAASPRSRLQARLQLRLQALLRTASLLRAESTRHARRCLPQRCALCAGPAGDALLCAACTAALPTLGAACPCCALPSPAGALCGACLAHPPPFAATLAAYAYAFPVDRLLQALKYGGQLALSDWAASALAARVRSEPTPWRSVAVPPLLVPLPLAAPRQRQRGFNQALEIARGLARELGLPLDAALRRRHAGPPQAGLPWAQRIANVRGVFTAQRRLDGLHVVLVDDVMTTGATLADAATAARTAGAARVCCWVVARTPPPRQS
jgi:ComF family protein